MTTASARLLLALLLVVAQGIGIRAAWPSPQGSLLGDVPICHAGSDDDPITPPGQPAPHHHDCALCPICHHAATPILFPVPAVAPVPAFRAVAAGLTLPPPATGPPRLAIRIPPSRAPPLVSA